MDDVEAIRRLKRGEIEGLETLVTRYQLRAVRTAYLVIQELSLAEDLAQEAFLQLFQRIRSFDETRPFEPYLMRSIVNAALNSIKKSEREIPLDCEEGEFERLLSAARSIEAGAEADELQEQILAALAKLPPRQRTAIVQRYYLEMSENEMSQALDAPAGTVKWLLNAARTRLRVLLNPERSK
ncbi:MAG: RNA polymerase sigma factor [Anaerolineaceae bacterium]